MFDGGDDLHVEGVFPTNSSYTKTAWVYRTGSGANGGNNIISGDTNSGGHALWARESNDFRLSAGHNGAWTSVIDSEALALDTWFHVALTYGADSELMTLYKNGAPVSGSGAVPTAEVTVPVTDATVSIGSFGASNGYMWQGTIDDARVYPVALSADQIAAMYNGGAGDSNTVVAAETTIDDDWQCQVTPFSDTEAGATVASNTVAITDGGTPVFAVTYDGNTNTGGTAPVDGASPYESGATVTVLAAGDLVKSGFMFDGWNTAANGSGIDYAPAATFAITADTTLYAQWLSDGSGPLVENVTLSSTSGSGLPSDDLSCAFDLSGAATTAAAVWSLDGSPFATLALPMEGGAVSALVDYSGNGNDAVIAGDAVWSATAGHDGNGAFEFDGTGDYLDAGAVFPVGSSYTKTAWVYRAGDGVANHHLNIMSSDEQDGSGPSVEHVLWAPGGYGFELAAGHGTNREVVRDSVALATGQWYHVAVTWDSVSGDMVLYKNGVPVDTGITTDVVNQAAVQVGGFDEQYVWQGTIDDARVYPVALSADQIAAMYNGGAGDSNTVVAAETTIDDDWQCQVTPFSDTEAGATVASNTVAITDGGTPDVTAPVLTVVAPLDKEVVASPVVLSGSAEDAVGVTYVQLEVKDRDSGVWWDGDSWSPDRVKFPAVLGAPVGDVTPWSFAFDPPGDGVTMLPYWMTVTAFDAAGNPSIRDTRYFSIESDDVTAPVLTVVAPLDKELVASPVVLEGSAEDAVGVSYVQLEVKDRDSGVWWDGDSWSPDRVKFPAVLGAPVGDVTPWSFSFDPPGDGVTMLPYWMTVTAFDAAGNPSVRDTRYFSIESDDVTAPVLTVVAPLDKELVASPVVLSGSAEDAVGVSYVQLEVKDRDSGVWWDGDSWSPDRVKFPAVLGAPVGDVTPWSFAFDPPGDGVTMLPYWMTVTAFDAAGNPSVRDTRYFSIESDDVTAPVLTVVAPLDKELVASPVVLEGSAEDAVGVSYVQLEVKDRDSGVWWDGDSWSPDRVKFPAVLGAPVGDVTPWLFSFDPPGDGVTMLPYWMTVTAFDAAGNPSVRDTRYFSIEEGDPPTVVASDDFDRSNLNPAVWAFVDPLGDSSVAMTGTGTSDAYVELSVPAGPSHDPWAPNNAARILQAIDDVDFEVEAKWDSVPGEKYQMQGIVVQQDVDNWLRFGLYHDGSVLKAFVASIVGGSASSEASVSVTPGSSVWVKVNRTGDTWTMSFSDDGSTWEPIGTFDEAMTVASGRRLRREPQCEWHGHIPGVHGPIGLLLRHVGTCGSGR